MSSSLFRKVLYSSGLAAMLSLAISNSYHLASAQTNNYPLLSMKILLVPENFACAPYGYTSEARCNILTYEKVEPQLNGGTFTETKDITAGTKVRLGNKLRAALLAYSRFIHDEPYLSSGERKSVIAVFDFGGLSRKSDFNVNIEWIQAAGKGCEGEQLQRETRSYKARMPNNHQYLIYHTSAELFVPCTNVTWVLKVTETESGKQYAPWTFRTTSQEN